MLFRKTPADVSVAPLTRGAATVCAAIHARSFHRGWDEAEIAALLNEASVTGLGATEPRSDRLAGFIMARRAADEAEILTIAVEPNSRRRGIAVKLLDAALARLAAAGTRTVFLEVETGNAAARALYERAGFRKIGERQSYYQAPGGGSATALILRWDAP